MIQIVFSRPVLVEPFWNEPISLVDQLVNISCSFYFWSWQSVGNLCVIRCKTTLPIVLTMELGSNPRLLRGEDKRSAWNLEFLCELICRCYVLMMQIGSSYTYLFFSKKKSRLCKVLCVDKPGWIIVPQHCGSLLSVKSWWSCIFSNLLKNLYLKLHSNPRLPCQVDCRQMLKNFVVTE